MASRGIPRQPAETGAEERRPAKRVTLKVLAEHLGLSPTTISLVLNKSPVADSIPKKTKDRVIAAAREFDYRPDFVARSLRRQRSFSVGVLVSEISGSYSAGIMGGIEHTLLDAGYFGLVASHRFNPEYLHKHLGLLRDRSVEGFILVNTPTEETPDLPTIAVSGMRMLGNASNVVIDHHLAAELAIDHLMELGHRKVAFFRGPPVIPDSEGRWSAIERSAEEKGIELREDSVFNIGDDPTSGAFSVNEFYRAGHAFGRELVERGSGITALFAFNDPSAIGAMRAFREAGLRVPDDISVVGFDDIDSAGFHNPGLTTIRQPLREMGSLAAEALVTHLAGDGDLPEQLIVEPELVVRESSAPVKGGWG